MEILLKGNAAAWCGVFELCECAYEKYRGSECEGPH